MENVIHVYDSKMYMFCKELKGKLCSLLLYAFLAENSHMILLFHFSGEAKTVVQ